MNAPHQEQSSAYAISTREHDQRMRAQCAWFTRAAAILSVVIGSACLLGWSLELDWLKSVIPGLVSMKANTALGFVLAGVALWLLRAGELPGSKVAAALSLLLAVLGLVTLCEWTFGWNAGIDQLLFREPAGAVWTPVPGRMAPATALNFTLVGASLLLLNRRRAAWLVQGASVVVVMVPLFFLIGYLYHRGTPGLFTPMAVHTAAVFCLLGAGILTARPEQRVIAAILSDGPGGRMARHLLPAAVLVPFVLGWIRLQGQRAGLYDVEMGVTWTIMLTINGLAGMIVWNAVTAHTTEARTRQVEADLRQSEQRFRITFEQAAIGFALVATDGRWLHINDKVCEITGYSREELLVRTFQDITHPEDLETDLGLVRRVLDGEIKTYTLEKRYLRKDRSIVFINLTVSLVRDEAGRPQYFIAAIEDISERKHADEALRSIEWMLTRRNVAGPDTAQRVGQAYGDLTLLNQERTILDAVGKDLLEDIVGDYLNLLGTSSAVYEKNGDYALGIFTSGWCRDMDLASFRGCATSDAREALGCGKWHCHESCWNAASRVSMQDGEPADIECAGGIRLYAVPIRAGDEIIGSINFGYGDPPRGEAELAKLAKQYGLSVERMRSNAAAYQPRPPFIIELAKERLLGSARLIGEIVQRRRAEESVRQLNATLESRVAERTRELVEAMRELDAFSYSVSHDLRAPLRAIDGFSKILLQQHAGELSPDARASLERVLVNTRQMGSLIDDLLAFSQLNRRSLRVDTVSQAAVIRECLDLLHADVEGRALEVVVDDLPDCRADAGLLKVVWLNLIGNSLKYTRRRDPARIEIGCRRNGENVYFVRDNGVGFDMAYAGKLFGVFQRLHRAEDYEGTGVGLATAQRVVQRHGGRIWAESAPDLGATFFFTLEPEAAT